MADALQVTDLLPTVLAATPANTVFATALLMIIPTLVFVLYVAVIWWGRRRLLQWINRLMIAQMKRVESAGARRIGVRRLLGLHRLFVRLLTGALVLGGAFLWITTLMDALPETHEWARRIEHSIMGEFSILLLAGLEALPGLGVLAVIFLLARAAHDMLSHYFNAIETGEVTSENWDPVTAKTTRRLAGVGLWAAAMIVAYPYIPGSQTSAFKGVSILAGLMLSLGSTNLVGQLVNGMVLIYSRAVRPGDVVVVDQVEGTIETIGLFSCALRTANDELVWLPNSALAAGVRNNSRPAGAAVRYTTQVTIGYDTPSQQVRDLLLGAAADTSAVRPDPAPFVRQVALEDFYVRYELVFAPQDPAKRKVVLSDLHEAILGRFHAAGVQIMSPHYRGDPTAAKIPPA